MKKVRELIINKNFFLLWTGSWISQVGSEINTIAISVWIANLTDNPISLGIVYALQKIVRILISPFAGVYVDTHNRKKILVLSDFLNSGLSILTLIVIALSLQTSISIVAITLIAITASILDAVFKPASRAILPELVEKDKLPKANSMKHFTSTSVSMLAFLAAGILVAIAGIIPAVLINGISFALSAFSEIFISYENKIKKEKEKTSHLKKLKDGFNYITDKKDILLIAIVAGILNFLFTPFYSVLIFYNLKDIHYSFLGELSPFGNIAIPVSLFMLVLSLGNLLGAIIPKKNNGNISIFTLSTSFFSSSLLFMILFSYFKNGTYLQFLFLLVAALLAGLSLSLFNIHATSYFQRNIQKEYAGRFFSFLTVFTQSLGPIGVLIFSSLGGILEMKILYIIGFIVASLSIFSFSNISKKIARTEIMKTESRIVTNNVEEL